MTTVITGQATFRIAAGSPTDVDAALAMVGRCSRTSLLHRFHGPSDGLAYTSGQMQRAGDVILAWDGSRCIGMGVLALDPGGQLHLGVLVEDDRQRQGVGRSLIRALVAEARQRGTGSLHADIMGDNSWLVAALRRIGQTRVVLAAGTFSVDIELS